MHARFHYPVLAAAVWLIWSVVLMGWVAVFGAFMLGRVFWRLADRACHASHCAGRPAQGGGAGEEGERHEDPPEEGLREDALQGRAAHGPAARSPLLNAVSCFATLGPGSLPRFAARMRRVGEAVSPPSSRRGSGVREPGRREGAHRLGRPRPAARSECRALAVARASAVSVHHSSPRQPWLHLRCVFSPRNFRSVTLVSRKYGERFSGALRDSRRHTVQVRTIGSKLVLPQRTPDGPFFFSFDHCFQATRGRWEHASERRHRRKCPSKPHTTYTPHKCSSHDRKCVRRSATAESD